MWSMALKIAKKYKKKLWHTGVLTSNATCTALARPLSTLEGSLGEGHYQSARLSDKACKGMIEAMLVWVMIMKGREEMHGSREEALQEERKKKEKKRKRKQKKEQKIKEKNAELRRRTKAMEIAHRQAYYDEEAKYYHAEQEYTSKRSAQASISLTPPTPIRFGWFWAGRLPWCIGTPPRPVRAAREDGGGEATEGVNGPGCNQMVTFPDSH
jgi:hypothetical protein